MIECEASITEHVRIYGANAKLINEFYLMLINLSLIFMSVFKW